MAPGAKWGAGDFFDNKPQSKTDMDDVRAYLSKALDSVRWAETRSSKNGVYKVTFFDENYSFYFQDFPSKLPNSWILARAYSILSGVLDSRRVRFSKRYHDAPNTATKILSDKTMILFSHFIFAVPSYHLVLLALEFIHNFNFPLPFCSLHSLFVFQLYSSTANLIMVHIIL